MEAKLSLFEWKEIRKVWNVELGDWLFSVVDVVSVLAWSEAKDTWVYWRKLKQRLKLEWSELVTNCHELKLLASDWKMRLTDVWDTPTILRLIQSIPSKKAEPFKIWLAKVWADRINEIADPEVSIERAISNYRKKWYNEAWITQRLKSIEIRKELTWEWDKRWIKEWIEYAILTNEILKEWSEMTTSEYKDFKWLKKESLKDNMSNLELVIWMLAEATTTEIMKVEDTTWFKEIKKVSKRWGKVAKNTRLEAEKEIWKKIISSSNNLGEWKNKFIN